MRKTILILILCAPLFYLAGREALRFYDVSTRSLVVVGTSEGSPHPKREDVEKAKADAAEIVNLPESVTASIIRLDPPAPGASEPGPLASAVVLQAQERDAKRKEVLKAKLVGTDIEKKIKTVLEGMLGPDGRPVRVNPELKSQLEDYQKEVHDPELVASAQAEAAWPDLENDHGQSVIDRFYKQIDAWSPATAEKSTLGADSFDEHATVYRNYLKRHESAKGAVPVALTREARDRLALLERGSKLVTLLQDSSKRGLEQLGELVRLGDNEPPKEFRTSLERVVHVLCDDLLKREPYDESVLLNSRGSPMPESMKRKDIQVVLKSGETVGLASGEAEPSGTSAYDEYNLKSEQIDSFVLPGETRDPPGPGVSPLKGTGYSDAIRAYNAERDRVDRWSERELLKLQEICVKHEAALQRGGGANLGGRTLITRINGLLEIVRRHASLFIARGS